MERLKERKRDWPGLSFIQDACQEQSRLGHGYGVEQPLGSAMWQPLPENHTTGHYYDCVRCQLGRACPRDIPHTLVPRECRYGRWAPGTGPRAKSTMPPDPLAEWKWKADAEVLDTIELNDMTSTPLSVQHRHWLKKLLLETIHSVLGIFSEAASSERGYQHGIENAVQLSLFKEIFRGHFLVRGVRIALRAWHKSDAQPHLQFRSGFYRLIINGDVKDWKINPTEDMREMSHSQINEAMDEDNWTVTLFGHDFAEAGGVPAPSTPVARTRAIPAERPLPPRQDDVLAEPELRERKDDDKDIVDAPYEQEEEFETGPREDIKPIRPNYNLKLVLRRLPKLYADEDITKCKQLLLGLHERLWHSPAQDFANLLRRAGMPSEIINLAQEAVQSCAVCRKYVRSPNRPETRANGAVIFNDKIQMDLFNWESAWFMLIVDEATRFKMCGTISGQESEDLLRAMLDLWIYMFGPPGRVVMDQQVSLMGHEAGGEFERLNIERCPRGTTAGHGAEQHTGTGIVERHVQLLKMTMYKLRAELQRQGLDPSMEELAQESAMAHNITLNYKGVTPSMAVFGTLPRGFYEVESDAILNSTGALQTDITVFERAVRIRQTALAQPQQAVVEDRVARASRTRPHQLDLSTLTAGTSEVEFYREVKNDPGWRGPALLLRLDADEGVAVIQYQGKPYLVSLRFIRPYRGIYMVEVQKPETDETISKMMRVEAMSDYKVYMYGWIRNRQDKWVKLPKENDEANRFLQKAILVSKAMTKRELNGCLFGKALRSFKPPSNTTGILLTWISGGRSYAVQEHKSDRHLQMKKITNHAREDTCILYFYYYNATYTEENRSAVDRRQQELPDSSMKSVTTSSDNPMDSVMESKKREGPETRTVVLAPEKKRQKMEYLKKDVEFMKSWCTSTATKNVVQLDFAPDWRTGYDLMTATTRNFLMRRYDMERQDYDYLFHLAYKTDHEVVACLRTARIYKVDDETAVLEDYDITPQMWPEIDEADKKEIQQFVDEKAFKPIHRLQLTQDMVKIDAKWVRKWKRYPDKSVKMKSRLCARGCLDQQKTQLTTRSTTATRLSQRLLVSQAARKKGKTIESWDIAGAFVKGFDFKSIQKALQKMGLTAPTRQVVIYPPMNVWRHLAKMSDMFKIPEHALHDYGLLCLKPVYGLNDAPLAWQLSLHTFLEELGATRSKMDENCFYWKKENKKKVDCMDNMYAMITTHVDDLAVMSTTTWLDEHYNKFVKRFQKVTRQQLPFDHCGCHYSKTGDGFAVTQKEFAEKMKAAPVPNRADDSRLTPEEISDFRSILGRVTVAEVKDIKVANAVLDKVKRNSEIGLHYRQFETENLRLVCVHDASSASKGRHYAQEGVLILLADDKWKGHTIDLEEEFDSQSVKAQCTYYIPTEQKLKG